MTVTVFGLGFVGLTTALGLAHIGHKVYGLEANAARLALLRRGKLPFHEPYMADELMKYLSCGGLDLSASVENAVQKSDIIFYCVGTPYGENGAADLTALFRAIDQTLSAIHDTKRRVLVTKSTIPPSTTSERIHPYVMQNMPEGCEVCTANNPEFLREGYCWQDFMEADRIVIGCDSKWGREMLTELYAPMQIPTYCVTPSTGEFIKYLSNTLLATLISYSNEMAQAGETIGGIQIADAFRILHMDKRWKNGAMASYAYPGCGYGGYCLPKDTCAFLAQAGQCGLTLPILSAVIDTNDKRPHEIARHIVTGLDMQQPIGIAGLAFKPGSDDVRESPAHRIIRQLKGLGYENIYVYDPLAIAAFQRTYPTLNLTYCASLEELCKRADRIAITTAWPEFVTLERWTGGQVVDCRYMLYGNFLDQGENL